jgi:hypothetical protein
MPEEETDVQQLELIRSESRAISGGLVSRVIEYLPAGGEIVIARDCSFAGQSYSKGAVVLMLDGNIHECTGDKDGSWKKLDPQPPKT